MRKVLNMSTDSIMKLSTKEALERSEMLSGDKGENVMTRKQMLEKVNSGKKVVSKFNFLVDTYISIEEMRIEMDNRIRNWLRDLHDSEEWEDMDFSNDNIFDKNGEIIDMIPKDMIKRRERLEDELKMLEKKIFLELRIKYPELSKWMYGIERVSFKFISKFLHYAGWNLISNNPFSFWSYAGFDGPGWKGRNYHHKLQTCCSFLLGQIAIEKTSLKDYKGDIKYRKIYDRRKEYEHENAEEKGWCGADRVEEDIKKILNGDDPRGCYSGSIRSSIQKLKKGEADKPEKEIEKIREHAKNRVKCTDGHIRNKARRYAVKQFLLHYWKKKQEIKRNLGFK